MKTPFETSPLLEHTAHGFFGRAGGVSQGIYDSFNTGPGSADDPRNVEENRRRAVNAIGAKSLSTADQTHSATALYIDEPLQVPKPEADALVADLPGLAVGVLTADCIPALFSGGGLVAAAHAGWRGSLDGILQATIALMEARGARASEIACALGPALRAPAFEVEEDLVSAVTGRFGDADRFFSTGKKPGKWIYDHMGFATARLVAAGLQREKINIVGGCTLTHSVRYFSYRQARQTGQKDYGRNLSTIAVRDT